jgi:hypothetical protein
LMADPLDFHDSLEIRLTDSDVFIGEASPAIAAGGARERNKLAMARRARTEVT